jgi:hypothetical protein
MDRRINLTRCVCPHGRRERLPRRHFILLKRPKVARRDRPSTLWVDFRPVSYDFEQEHGG